MFALKADIDTSEKQPNGCRHGQHLSSHWFPAIFPHSIWKAPKILPPANGVLAPMTNVSERKPFLLPLTAAVEPKPKSFA